MGGEQRSASTIPQVDGVLVLNKPSGPSSNQCLNSLKRAVGKQKIGHAGTLDPLAQGVLLVLFGQATKLSNYLMGKKTYKGTLLLGQTTDTWDSQGQVLQEKPWQGVSEADVREAVLAWKGVSEQEVPSYSAAKHQGKPLYKLARLGLETPVKKKRIEIFCAELISVDLPRATFRVTCSSGAYIRSLAHSLGIRLGCGAVLTELTREYSHPFSLDEAVSLETLIEAPERLTELVAPIEAALAEWPRVVLNAAEEAAVRNGTALPVKAEEAVTAVGNGAQALLFSPSGAVLALAEHRQGPDGSPVWAVLRGLWR